MEKVYVGIDIGGTNTIWGFVTENGELLSEHRIPTQGYENFDLYLLTLKDKIFETFVNYAHQYKIKGIGIGAPNANYYNGTIENAPNLKWGEKVIHFKDKFEGLTKLPVVLTNDANAAAVGEGTFGAAKGMNDFIVITLGTGLGSGIIANGKLVLGHDSFAGEIGHTTVNPNGRMCGCGRRGCLETYVSATGIKRTVYKLLADRIEDSILRSVPFDRLTAKNITEAALQGDIVAKEAFEYTGEILGAQLANTVAHLSPEAIFLFGGLAKAGNFIFEPTRRAFENSLLSIYKGKVKILPSGLIDKNVAVLGSASLAVKEFGNK